ncbi:3-methyl-2-oxobutanoate hydroxymethyltransferase [Pseudoxanthobacter sp.]|uniref:3-methyl-2-oxobutanoate hydroxymethyltransferase n=1 Tax=Pseudoxanthobacter sp. TaxID=1925742 RepID=UPI002FE3416F
MSVTNIMTRVSVPDVMARKGAEPVVVLTAYTAPMAGMLDPHVDILLVGDSLGMVVYGLQSTLAVTTDMMIAHGAAVVRGSSRAMVVIDLAFGTYQESPEQAFRTAARVMAETGCTAVKLEGGIEMADTVRFLVERGIPVMGHVGLTPQAVNHLGGFRARGRSTAEQDKILSDAQAIAEAGAFAIVVEAVVEPLARRITETIPVPTIGIGGSAACDGQVLVIDDVIGTFSDFKPRFARRYADLGPQIGEAARLYAEDVRARRFPGAENTFALRQPART